jgi:hypothetical protein
MLPLKAVIFWTRFEHIFQMRSWRSWVSQCPWCLGGGVQTGSTRHVDHLLAYCTCPDATLSTTNPTWPDPGLNPGRSGGKPATNRFSYGAAMSLMLLITSVNLLLQKQAYCTKQKSSFAKIITLQMLALYLYKCNAAKIIIIQEQCKQNIWFLINFVKHTSQKRDFR